MTQNKRLNPNSKHVCLLIAKTESHQRKKKKQGTKRNSEEAKRTEDQPKTACLHMAHCTAQTPLLLSLAPLVWQGQCWELVSDGVPLAAPPLPGHGGDLLGAGCLSALPSAAVVVMTGTLWVQARFREELIQAACLQLHRLVLCVAKSYPGCGRKCPAGCSYVKSHLLILFWIQWRGRGYKLAKSIGPLCLRIVCSS